MLKSIFYTVAFSLLSYSALAQPALIEYMENIAYFNPAGVAYQPCDSLKITSFYRNQWVGINGSPQNFTAMAEYNLNKINSGIGFNFSHERLGFYKNLEFGFSYRYSIKFNNDRALSVGASLDYYILRMKGLLIFPDGSTHPVNSSDANITSRFGLLYSSKSLILGASIFHPFEPVFQLDFMASTHQFRRLYNFHGSYKFRIDVRNTLTPELVVFARQSFFTLFNLKWNRLERSTYGAGLKVLPGSGMPKYTANISYGIRAFEKFYFGAAYEYFFGNNFSKMSNAVECMVRYDLRKRNQDCRIGLVNPTF